jgi:hypothetical protein
MEMKQHNITQRDFNDEKISEEKMKEPQQNVESEPSTINKCLNGNSIEVSKIIQKKGSTVSRLDFIYHSGYFYQVGIITFFLCELVE